VEVMMVGEEKDEAVMEEAVMEEAVMEEAVMDGGGDGGGGEQGPCRRSDKLRREKTRLSSGAAAHLCRTSAAPSTASRRLHLGACTSADLGCISAASRLVGLPGSAGA